MKIPATKMLYVALLCSTIQCFQEQNASDQRIKDPIEEIFTHIYKTNYWLSSETVSGSGSELRITYNMRQALSALIKQLGITSIADAPCGDLNWMKHVDIGTCTYTGIDIVQELIEHNMEQFGDTKTFKHLNLLEHVIEKADLIICRDLLAHLTYEQIFKVLRNFKKSGSKYLLVTTGLNVTCNHDLDRTGEFRFINLELAPFYFPRPLALIEEDVHTDAYAERGKHLALWLLDDIIM